MSNFTYFLRCCCQSACEDEEEKKASECIKNDTISGKIKDFNRDYIEEPFIIDAHQPYCDSSLLETLKLEVKVLESDKIPAGTTVIINPAGMEGSKRGKLDGKTFFGCSPEENGEILNDFAVDDSSEGAIRQYFYISFNQKSMKYCITDLDQGPGTFLRIDSPIVLKDGFIISFGNSHITVHYNPISKSLALKFLEGPKSQEIYYFDSKDEMILVGRMIDCKLRFDDNSISRYQCSIYFQNDVGWTICDGIDDKKSMNGTWLYVDSSFEILQGMVFRTGKTLFEMGLIL